MKVLLMLCLLANLVTAETPTNLTDHVVEPDQTVDGTSLPTYANIWWQWAHSQPSTRSAVRDETGALCAEGQSGPVWFLAGGYGSSKIDRVCEVAADKYLFFPIINMLQARNPATQADCQWIKAAVAASNETFVYLKVILNGQELDQPQRFRIASDICFDPYARVPGEVDRPPNILAATDGYWIMLRPLPPGRHHLGFRAFYTNPDEAFGDMVQNIDYTLDIAE